MRKTLLTYVKPHVQEDPLSMILGIGYPRSPARAGEHPDRPARRARGHRPGDEGGHRGQRHHRFQRAHPEHPARDGLGQVRQGEGKITIMGGPHASVDQGVFLDSGHFDYVLKGEAEYTLPQLLKAIDGGVDADLEDVPGLAAMRDGELWVDNPAPPLIKKLDELPMPARHLLPMQSYFENNPERLIYIFTTRGCPFKCIFCQKELTGRGFRVRSTEAIVDELEHILKTYDPGVILFVDEILTLRKKRIHEMCDEILRRGLKFEWVANTRADCVDYPLLKHMHRAGCRRIYYGWESGSQRMLDVLKKDLTPEQIVEAARMTRRAGCRPRST
ncbi:MAG: radical SAM protein [Planctomycetota bacterium]